MSAVFALAKPHRIKASHRRRRKVAAGRFVQRYYDPVLGRFLSPDPVSANTNNGDNFNRYWYANDNPYVFTDPDGRYGRGTGWDKDTWATFNRAQQNEASKLTQAASKLDRALDTGKIAETAIAKNFEAAFGKGTATVANMTKISSVRLI